MSAPPITGAARRHTTTRRSATPHLTEIALAAARQNLSVFPLWPRTKIPCLHGRRRCHGRGPCERGHLGWEQRASTDPDLIRTWWGAAPASNVGIACGPSGLYVIDLDPAHGGHPPPEWAGARHGRDVLARLAEQAGEPYPDHTYRVRSPSSGEHLYFRVDPDCALRSTAGLAGWRVDSRGSGGFIVAAGSRRPDGRYTVVRPGPIAALPIWLVPHFTPPARPVRQPTIPGDAQPLSDSRRRHYLDTVAGTVADAAAGTSHDTLLRSAFTLGRLVAGGEFTDTDARAALHAGAQRRRIPDHEADAVITDALEAGRRQPRRLADRAR